LASKQPDLFEQSDSASQIGSASAPWNGTGPACRSTRTPEQCDTTAMSTSSQAAIPASKTASPMQAETVIACGRTHSDRSNDIDLFTCFEKMFLEMSQQEPLNELNVTLYRTATKSGLTLYRLMPLARLTSDCGHGRWPTPTAQDHKNATMPPSQAVRKDGSIPVILARLGFVGWRLNPRFYEQLMMYPVGWTE